MLTQLLFGGFSGTEIVYYLIVMFIALTLSFAFHEFMHAAVAVWLGDPTPRNMGRLTLNPLAHLDMTGTICILLVGFGWGKPVVYNPNNLKRFKSKRFMRILVNLAGVFGNFILAIVADIIYCLLAILSSDNSISSAFIDVSYYLMIFNLSLLAFNLIPVPPLDGFHVLEEILPLKVRYSEGYRKFLRYGPQVLMILILVGAVTGFDLLGTIMGVIEIPFKMVLSAIMKLMVNIFL